MDQLDDVTAWQLVRQARRVCPGRTGPVTLEANRASLRVRPGGGWQAQPPANEAAAQLFDLYLPLCATPRAGLVIAQMAQSIDGYVATASGDSCYVSGPEDRAHLHCLRALVDAVIVGAATIEADDPRLTVRAVEGEQPVRVVLARSGALNPDAHVLADGVCPTLIVHAPDSEVASGEGLAVPVDTDGYFESGNLIEALAQRGLRRVLVEGGGQTVSRFLRAGLIDRLHVTVAPLLIGDGRRGIDLPRVDRLQDAMRPPARRFPLADDVLFDLDLG